MSFASYSIPGGDYEHGGAASRSVKEQLKKVGADPGVVRRAMVAAYEAEMNVVIHARRGELRATLQNGQLDVEVIDEGPGIPDIEQAMRSGFSTASPKARELGFGAGMGLPNIKKNSDRFTIESTVGCGTQVRFTIFLKPQALYGAGRNSLRIDAPRCRQSLRCLSACPTQALRVFRGKPEVLDYLCIDCTACIAVCPSGALTIAGGNADGNPLAIPSAAGVVLVVPAESLVQFGAGVSPQRVLAELAQLGFADIRVTAAWETALRSAVVEYASGQTLASPVISPACPAVVNLIETRFPGLIPNIAPFLSATEALLAELGPQRAVFVASCLCQRTAVLGNERSANLDVVLPATLRAAIAPRVATGAEGTSATAPGDAAQSPDYPEVMRVTGIRHVLRVLEAVEDGLAGDVRVIEPWACNEGCFGSPLMTTDPFLARRRWLASAAERKATTARAVRRTKPLSPRPGLRLDNDMTQAIQKLARIDKLRRRLPGSDCAMCGAPTCAALAEDIVLGRANMDACVRQRLQGDAAEDGTRNPPAPEEKAK